MTSNPSELFNGMTSAQPFEPYEIDQHPDAARIWASISRHRAEAFEDGAVDDAEQIQERSESDTISQVIGAMQSLNVAIVNGEWDYPEGRFPEHLDPLLEFFETVKV